MHVTLFTPNGRYRGTASGVDADVTQVAAELGAVLVEGEYRDCYLPGGELPPVPLTELIVPDVVERTLDFGDRYAGDSITVDTEEYTLAEDEPVVIAFGTGGEYMLAINFLGHFPCRFKLRVL